MARRDRRQAILQAAEGLFTSRRYHELTTDDIAHAARVGKGTIYRYFEDKDDLFFQVATSGFDELCEVIRSRVPEDAPFAEQLLSACREIHAFFDRRRPLMRLMHQEGGGMLWREQSVRERWRARRKELLAALAEILQKGVEEAKLRDDVPCEVLAAFLLGMLRTRGQDLADAPEAARSDEFVVDLFCRGAGRRGSSEKG